MATAAAFALACAAPADAASKKKSKHRVPQHAAMTGASPGFQGGVMRGPLYNGQDYLGDDPDPNIRAYMIRDLGMRYGRGH
jgi:hypothetical protein